jgi:hypothetical protein
VRSTDRSSPRRARSWRTATITSFVLSGLILAAALYAPDEQGKRFKRVDVPEEILQCTADGDCELVDKIGCCACTSGGARWAINRQQEDTLRRFLKRACRHRAVCAQVNACQPDLLPACIAGRCVARPGPSTGESRDG